MRGESMEKQKHVPLLLWPFRALWRLVGFILEMVGRLVAVILGAVIAMVGVLLSLTVVGAVIGVPLVLFGIMLMFRGLF